MDAMSKETQLRLLQWMEKDAWARAALSTLRALVPAALVESDQEGVRRVFIADVVAKWRPRQMPDGESTPPQWTEDVLQRMSAIEEKGHPIPPGSGYPRLENWGDSLFQELPSAGALSWRPFRAIRNWWPSFFPRAGAV